MSNLPTNRNSAFRLIGLMFGVTSCHVGHPVLAENEQELSPIPMHIELETLNSAYPVGENFVITVRIVNPNAYDVMLKGFTIGPHLPRLEMTVPGSTEFHPFPRGDHGSGRRAEPVLVPGRGTVEADRFIYYSFGLDRWRLPIGAYHLRATLGMNSIGHGKVTTPRKVNWVSSTLTFQLVDGTAEDARARAFLYERFSERQAEVRRGEADDARYAWETALYREFLGRFSESAYAPEIRWETARLLLSLDHKTVEQEGMAELLDECLTFCLERGGAYAEDFLEWDAEVGGSNVFQHVGLHCRHELLELLVRKLDERYPVDEVASAYRRTVELIVTEDFDAARVAAEAFKTKYPDSKYGRHVKGALRSLERRASTNRAYDGLP